MKEPNESEVIDFFNQCKSDLIDDDPCDSAIGRQHFLCSGGYDLRRVRDHARAILRNLLRKLSERGEK